MDTKRLQGLICAGMLSGALVLTGVANAAVVTNRLPLLGYADHNISVYRAPGGITSAVVAAETALIQITQVRADGWAYGTYPMSNGRRASGWFRMNDVQGDVNFNNVNGKILYQQTVYRTTAMSGGNGVLPQGASVLVIAEQGGLSQIVYKQPNSMNWRLGWVLSDAVQKEQQVVASVNQTRSSVMSQPKTSAVTKAAVQPKTKAVTKTIAQSGTDTASKNVAQKPELNIEIKTTTSTQPTASNNTVQASKNTIVVKNSNQNKAQQQNEASGSPNAQQGNIIVLDTNNASSLQLGQTTRKVVNKYGKVLQQAAAYPNANLTNRQNGEYAGKGDTVIVLEEFGHSYKITYPAKDRLKDRWVYKDNISLNAGVNYQSWQGTMIKRADVYHDLNLQLHPVATEYAEKGDTVTVLNEALNSYFISYPLTNGSYKARWVEKSAVSGTNPNNRVVVPVVKEDTNPIIKPVERTNNGIKGDMNQDGKVDKADLEIMSLIQVEKIQATDVHKIVGDMNGDGQIDIIDLSNLTLAITRGATTGMAAAVDFIKKKTVAVTERMKYLSENVDGFINDTKYNGNFNCKGFADKLYTTLFNVKALKDYSDDNYSLKSYIGSQIHSFLYNFGEGENDLVLVKEAFLKAKPGSFVQMGRRHSKNSHHNAPKPHSAIVYEVNDKGCYLYEANADEANTIEINFYTWQKFTHWNKGFTIYVPTNYSLK